MPSQAVINQKVQVYINQDFEKTGFNHAALTHLLAQAHLDAHLLKMMKKPLEGLPWHRYQALYVRPSLIDKGVLFYQAHQTTLMKAQKQYEVPPEIIVSLLGVETNYGGNQGQDRALDVLYTLSFAYPRREHFFQNELTQFLLLSREGQFDPLSIKSSYAGALGMPQFMPSSYRRYAVSNTQHFPNLFTNADDAILSIGHYLAQAGWKKEGPVLVPAHLGNKVNLRAALQYDTLSLKKFRSLGIEADVPYKMPDQLKAALITVQGKAGPEYYLAFHNFYVIKRYNGSNLYTLAAYELAQKIKAGVNLAKPNAFAKAKSVHPGK